MPTQAQAFQMRLEDQSAPTAAGTILYHDFLLRILFETGATHCFIADSCMAKLGLHCTSCPSLLIGMPDGSRVRTGREIVGCPVRIGERDWPADLIVMPLKTDDLILGMNFMGYYDAIINLRTRTVSILAEDGSEHHVWGSDPKQNGALVSSV